MPLSFFFFFNDTATTEIYTLSLHDALPIWSGRRHRRGPAGTVRPRGGSGLVDAGGHALPGSPGSDRKSTRLNSSHMSISYAVFCLKKKKKYVTVTRSTHCINVALARRVPDQ